MKRTQPLGTLRTLGTFIWCIAASAVLSCQYNPFAHEFVTTEPRSADLPGEYVLDDESIAMLSRSYHVAAPLARLTLNLDGSFRITSVPSCWRASSSCNTTEDAAGRWAVAKHQTWWAVQLRCSEIDGRRTNYGLQAMLRGDGPPFILHFTVGDPDTGEALAFRRHSAPS